MTSPGKKLLLWSIILLLILACVPAAVTPSPTLDPNSINLLIAQTANSAFTQTAAAIPVFETTSTSISAPTFTPEPTFTSVPLIILSSPTTIPRTQYFRVKHDSQLAIYNYQSRTAAAGWEYQGEQTPEVVPLFVDPKFASGTHRTVVDGNWEIYINALNNNNARKLRFLKAGDTALFNGAGFPQLESLTMGGNVITLDEIQGGWGRVHTINYVEPGALKEVDYTTRPDLVHKITIVGWSRKTKQTYWAKPPQGDVYWPFVSSRPVWVQLERLEAFPILPMNVVANINQDIRKRPEIDSPRNGKKLKEGETARIMEYYPSGPNVWGKIQEGGWVALLLNGQYSTSWSMATFPPP
jgi:hypothetical protein